jgi:hypothetical protein
MENWKLRAEAEECRLLAAECADGTEKSVLLCLATAFDDLHVRKPSEAHGAVRENV